MGDESHNREVNMGFTDQQTISFLDDCGKYCPYCGHGSTTVFKEISEPGTDTKIVGCDRCNKKWKEIWVLTGVMEND